MGQALTAAWKDATLLSGSGDEAEKSPPRNKLLQRAQACLAQDPRSPARVGSDVLRTPIQVTDNSTPVDTPVQTTPPATKLLPFDPRSPGIERSPIVVADADGTPVLPAPVAKSRSLAAQRNHDTKQKVVHRSAS